MDIKGKIAIVTGASDGLGKQVSLKLAKEGVSLALVARNEEKLNEVKKEAVILNHLDQDGSMVAILEILPKLPFNPVFIQTDNGLEFQGRFHQMCEDMKLKHHMIHKNTPNENALIERSFRTDEEEFFFWLEKAPQHYDELRSWFATWLHEYNYERPHLGINLKTPYEVVANVMLH